MGCDIHLHIEVKIDGVWEHYGCPIIDRNYELFSKMAGVRNNPKSQEPISEPKGVPNDITKITRLDYEDWDSDAHSASWLDLDEIVMLTEWLKEQSWGIRGLGNNLEWGILRTYLFQSGFDTLVKYPDEIRIPGLTDVRFIFWFDN